MGSGKAMLEPRRQRMVVAQRRLACRRPELSAHSFSLKTTTNLAKPRIDIGFVTNNVRDRTHWHFVSASVTSRRIAARAPDSIAGADGHLNASIIVVIRKRLHLRRSAYL